MKRERLNTKRSDTKKEFSIGFVAGILIVGGLALILLAIFRF